VGKSVHCSILSGLVHSVIIWINVAVVDFFVWFVNRGGLGLILGCVCFTECQMNLVSLFVLKLSRADLLLFAKLTDISWSLYFAE